MVYRTAYGVTGSHEDAEDVLQTIFLTLVRREVPQDFARNPEAYLHRAAVNSSLNTIRSRRRQPLVHDDRLLEVPYSSESDDRLDRERMYQRLYAAIAELKPEHAEILILRYMHNKSDAEIAKMFGVSRGTIAIKLFRSRAQLRKLLRARLGDES
jgi:RNA polymerase sigma-70 factor (ECF subfamily)